MSTQNEPGTPDWTVPPQIMKHYGLKESDSSIVIDGVEVPLKVQSVEQRYLSSTEAATYAGVSERWLREWIKTGRLPAFRDPENPKAHYRVRMDDIDAMYEAGRVVVDKEDK